MASYIVMEPQDAVGQGEAHIFRDAFTLLAFLFAPFWLAWHRLWVEAVVVFALQLVLIAVGEAYGLVLPAMLLSLLASLFVGLEAPALRAAGLRRRGYADWGVVEADNVRDAEIRYATGVEAEQIERPRPVTATMPAAAQSSGAPALGLLGYTGR